MTSVLQDVRYGVRILGKTPGISAVAALTLALGIGANTTIFTVADAMLFRALRFEKPDRLVILSEQNTKDRRWHRNPALATSREWQKHAHSFAQIEFAVNYTETASELKQVDSRPLGGRGIRSLRSGPVGTGTIRLSKSCIVSLPAFQHGD